MQECYEWAFNSKCPRIRLAWKTTCQPTSPSSTRRASRSKTPNKLTEQKEFRDLTELKKLDSCLHSHANCLFFLKTAVPVVLAVHVCRAADRVVGHPRPPFSGIGVPWVSLPGPPMCPGAQGGIKAERQPFCGCWCVVLSMSCAYTSTQVQRDFTLLFVESSCIAFPRVSCSVSDDNS